MFSNSEAMLPQVSHDMTCSIAGCLPAMTQGMMPVFLYSSAIYSFQLFTSLHVWDSIPLQLDNNFQAFAALCHSEGFARLLQGEAMRDQRAHVHQSL